MQRRVTQGRRLQALGPRLGAATQWRPRATEGRRHGAQHQMDRDEEGGVVGRLSAAAKKAATRQRGGAGGAQHQIDEGAATTHSHRMRSRRRGVVAVAKLAAQTLAALRIWENGAGHCARSGGGRTQKR